MVEIFSSLSIHLGLVLGLLALVLLTVATVLVLISEPKFVKIHGYFAGSAWILTLINVLSIFTLSPDFWLSINAGIHWSHIILGAIGLIFGFLSMLFGIAAERKPAKLTGYITLICWWSAFFSGFLLL